MRKAVVGFVLGVITATAVGVAAQASPAVQQRREHRLMKEAVQHLDGIDGTLDEMQRDCERR